MVHPPSWRKPEHYMWSIITQYQILHLNMISKRDSTKLFGASTKVDWYVVQKCVPTKSTHIHDELNLECDIDIRLWKWLPGAEFSLIHKLFDFTGKHATFDVIYSRSAYGTDKKWVSKIESSKFCHPVVHTITQSGLGIVYTDATTRGHFNIPKVLLNTNERQYPHNDFAGKYGMGSLSYGLPITSKKEGDTIISAINRDEFQAIIRATKWSTFQTDWRMWNSLRCDFYKLF